MAEILAFTRVTSNLAEDNRATHVWMWDVGPPKPEPPARPKSPKGEEGNPEFDLAMITFREELADYEEALKRYRAQKEEYAAFQKQWGGPYETWMWSADATDALERDKLAVDEGRQSERRWYISSRNRGWESSANQGLPKGLKPGKGHYENLRREQEANAELAQIKRQDPVFGATENAR